MEEAFNKTTVSYFAAGLVIGFIVGFLVTGDEGKEAKYFEDEKTPQAISDDTVLIPNQENRTLSKDIVLRAEDQKAGVAVTVAEVNVPSVSWIAIREDKNGELSWILGARKLASGVHKDVYVPLQRSTTAGMLYHVVVYEDDGDNIFDYKADNLVSLENGKFLTEDFRTL